MDEREVPTVNLVGTNGNAFAVISAVKGAMRDADWTKEEMTEIMDDMMSINYNHLLAVVCTVCEVD